MKTMYKFHTIRIKKVVLPSHIILLIRNLER